MTLLVVATGATVVVVFEVAATATVEQQLSIFTACLLYAGYKEPPLISQK